MEFSTFISVCKKFLAYNFFVVFVHFSQRIRTWHQILCFMVPISNYKKKTLFANSKAKHG
jgi:hypothetical protein